MEIKLTVVGQYFRQGHPIGYNTHVYNIISTGKSFKNYDCGTKNITHRLTDYNGIISILYDRIKCIKL